MSEIERVRRLVIECARGWREAPCSFPFQFGITTGDYCYGENHIEECPCERARQDLIAALNKLEMVDPRPG